MKVMVIILSMGLCGVGLRLPADRGLLSYYDLPLPLTTESVMTPGMSIVANTRAGMIKIRAGDGTARHYSWSTGEQTVRVLPKTDRSDNGCLGLQQTYARAYSQSFFSRLTHCRHNTIACDEGQMNFSSERQAFIWLCEQCSEPFVCNDNGLCVAYRSGGDVYHEIDIFQIYIDGKKPVHFPGASNAIQVHGIRQIPDTTTAPLDSYLPDTSKLRREYKAFQESHKKLLSAYDFYENGEYLVRLGEYDSAIASFRKCAKQSDAAEIDTPHFIAEAQERKRILDAFTRHTRQNPSW
jgi:hypothetical protein